MPPSDAELMQRVQSGDRRAFDLLVGRHKDQLFNYLLRLVGRPELADDLAQEAFVRLWTKAHLFRLDGKLSGYLFRIATNLVRSDARQKKRQQLLMMAWGESPERDIETPAAPDVEAGLNETQRAITQALAGLPLRYRAPLVLHCVEGLPYEQVAETLACPLGTVATRIRRGRERLRRALGPHLQAEGDLGGVWS